MTRLSRYILAIILGLATALPAMASPVGQWEIEFGDSRYDVTMCGDGTQLCAELIWLGNGADNAENMPYLNTLLIDRATPVRPGQWRGKLHLFGQTADGTITQVNAGQITLRGCVVFVICKSYDLYRMAP
ncbi:DUF2147 domain-containing protein [Devosia sp. YIM 151766]|uniref:DUF2147 domain-containing protein n=1 Tax=Devosia sp. YIM 151766 TaxID=3017325 RepID=UPI00255C31E8|nr:DUF2147 domain-containing protein [Devosia sp. YIM 151766]WIY51838.1 DUF2147 domain-containing protein [Devosia sp. YIM 151766]